MALKCFRRLVLVGCLSEVLRLMASRWDCEVTLDEGVPGCGKTNFIKQKANLEQTLILTPGRINCEEFVSAGYVGQTADSFVVKNGYICWSACFDCLGRRGFARASKDY